MKPFLPLLAIATLLGCGGLRAEDAAAPEATDHEEAIASLPTGDLAPKLLYRFLLAEIAGQRGQAGTAAEIYADLAKETRDPRIVRRATEIALHARRFDVALQGARLWTELDPKSSQAQQTLVSLLAAQGQQGELQGLVAAMLAAEPDRLGQNLLHLNRLFVRNPDRKVARELVDALAAPYLQKSEAWYVRALAAFDVRDLPAARSHIRQALSMKPDWEAAALFHVQLIENRAEAIAVLGEFIAANPTARDARLAYARALVGEKRFEEARREFAKLLEGAKDPAKHGDTIFAVAILSLQLNDTREAEVYLRQLVEIGHAESDKARLYLGQISADAGRIEEALGWFGKVGRGEHYLQARTQAAGVLAKQGRIEEARRILADSEAGNPRERVQLLVAEAQLLREAGRIVDAHAVLVTGLAQQPDQPELLYETALLAEKLGRIDELESHLRRLIELKPDHAHAHNALGYSFAERNIRLDEATKLIERALELSPDDPFILDSKGWVQFRKGATQAALDTLNKAFGIRPDPEIAAHLGEVLWASGRQDEARATWEKARRDHPANEVLAETIKRFLP